MTRIELLDVDLELAGRVLLEEELREIFDETEPVAQNNQRNAVGDVLLHQVVVDAPAGMNREAEHMRLTPWK